MSRRSFGSASKKKSSTYVPNAADQHIDSQRGCPGQNSTTDSMGRTMPSIDDYASKRDNPLFDASSSSASESETFAGDNAGRKERSIHGVHDRRRGRSLSKNSRREGPTHSSHSRAAELKAIDIDCEQSKSCLHPSSGVCNNQIYEVVRSELRRAVSEIRGDLEMVICGRNQTGLLTVDVADFPSHLLNPAAIELMADVRREYIERLRQSQERSRKLRANLEAEEQHENELSRILRKLCTYSQIPEAQRTRTRHKSSIERRRISKSLAEDALNYFDECMSVSTFNNSDFSSFEDPLLSSVAAFHENSFSLSCALPSHISNEINDHNKMQESEYQTPCTVSICGTNLTSNSSFNSIHDDELPPSQSAFQSSEYMNNSFSLRSEDIKFFIKSFEKGAEASRSNRVANAAVWSCSPTDKFSQRMSSETFLYEKVMQKNRIEFGSMLLCEIRTFL